VWDSPAAFVGSQPFALPEEGWIVRPAQPATLWGLRGGSSSWKTNAPAVEISMDRSLPVTGWVTKKTDGNEDNVGLWTASDQVLSSWQYRVRVYRE
jgi:hypothetical protein